MLSEFTGAADELSGAFLVNPHDIRGMKDTIVRAARVPPAEARRRMRSMRRRVREHDVAYWAASFLSALEKPPPGAGSPEAAPEPASGPPAGRVLADPVAALGRRAPPRWRRRSPAARRWPR